MNLPELLAPAADIECAEAAFAHGADAAYIGLESYNLRARTTNATPAQLKALLEIAKASRKKVYAALNIMPDDRALGEMEAQMAILAKQEIFPDAFIVSDPGVIALCHEFAPTVPLHLSTQTGTFNAKAMEFWATQGIRRIILPRELTLEQIAGLCRFVKAQVEVFIHGAMCVSVSGRCLLGVYTARRHPNFGDCRQPCRFKYRIAPVYDNENDAGDWLTVNEEPGEGAVPSQAFILNSKDLCCLPILDRIIAAGPAALKIEGRHRSVHYVSSVVKIYRAALDSLAAGEPYDVRPEWREELDRLDHRPYTTGFYAGEYELQDIADSRPAPDERIVGHVREKLDGKGIVIDVKNPFCEGDVLNVLPVRKEKMPFEVVIRGITGLDGVNVKRALTNRLVIVDVKEELVKGDLLRKKS
ncbi:MAG TPA: U32 family peptidase C-terminal domain-containing protein [Chitinivibrionales bacterium]|nr:U32 family peptidase C-terminal domain-containing protein [Chitinivibrionales bacterium]